MAYVSVGDVRKYLDISGAGDDELIETLIASAQVDIDNYTRRTFEASADTTMYFDDSSENIDGLTLILGDYEICSITTVTNGDNIEVASDEYTTIPRNETPYRRIRILSNSGKLWQHTDEWMDAISILGRWSYSTTAPSAIAHACKRLAAFKYKQRDQQMFDVTAIEAGVVVAPVGIPADVRRVLAPYVKP